MSLAGGWPACKPQGKGGASQGGGARLSQGAVEAKGGDGVGLRATGSVIALDGLLKLYKEGRDDPENNGAGDDQNRLLPPMKEGETLALGAVKPEQHFTQPPPRFTEASLVKRLEELGIGRPSTYASIISVLQDRDYVTLDSRRAVPECRGRVVAAVLAAVLRPDVVQDCAPQLEEQLDDISAGRAQWKAVLDDFWTDFSAAVGKTEDLTITAVIDALDEDLGPHFFPSPADGGEPRKCPGCGGGRLGLKLGKFGAFIGCSNYPECKFTRKLTIAGGADDESDAALAAGPIALGFDAESGEAVTIRKGPYGPYIQLGEAPGKGPSKGDAKAKPKRVPVPKGMNPLATDLATAGGPLALPTQL